eukprot:TRINITY_DN2014_c0_g1_i1.p1 TRINITY_DN2014_c0_g1~~TRINITY_DN2014_c0_g1_i1.p1  ORF type:complete len:284 (+),score=26.95 TRINITY_DN2014_c0_g1_i1:2-853(+)
MLNKHQFLELLLLIMLCSCFSEMEEIIMLKHNADCDYSSYSPKITNFNEYFEAETSDTDATAFEIKYVLIKGEMELKILDEDNYIKFSNYESSYDFKEVTGLSNCDDMYVQFTGVGSCYHVIAKCINVGGCEAVFAVNDSHCSTLNGSSCRESWDCGYCTSIGGSSENHCVPGSLFAPDYDIKCGSYRTDRGLFIVFGGLFLFVCCFGCCAVCGYRFWQAKTRPRRTVQHQECSPQPYSLDAILFSSDNYSGNSPANTPTKKRIHLRGRRTESCRASKSQSFF